MIHRSFHFLIVSCKHFTQASIEILVNNWFKFPNNSVITQYLFFPLSDKSQLEMLFMWIVMFYVNKQLQAVYVWYYGYALGQQL